MTTVYCDESGRFEDRRARVAVVGFEIGDDRLKLNTELRRTFVALWPFLRWPIHAAHLVRPGWLVAAWLAWLDGRDLGEVERRWTARGRALPHDAASFATATEATWQELEWSEDYEHFALEQAWAAARGFVPRAGALFTLTRFAAAVLRCRRAPLEPFIRAIRSDDKVAIDRVVAVQRDALPWHARRVIERLSEQVFATLVDLVRELAGHAWIATDSSASGEDRYLALLRCLGEHLEPGARVRVQGRHVWRSGRPQPLDRAIAREALGVRDVTVDAFPWEGDPTFPIGHVAADLIAFRSGRWLGSGAQNPGAWAREQGLASVEVVRCGGARSAS